MGFLLDPPRVGGLVLGDQMDRAAEALRVLGSRRAMLYGTWAPHGVRQAVLSELPFPDNRTTTRPSRRRLVLPLFRET